MKKEFELYNIRKFKDFREVLSCAEKEDGEKAAFVYRRKKDIVSVTYRELRHDTLYLGSALFKMGYSSRHVACIGDNSYRWLTVYLTMLNSDGVFVPVDRQLPEDDIVTVLNHSEAEVLFLGGRFRKTFDKIRDRLRYVKEFVILDGESETGYTSYEALKEKGKRLYESGYMEYEKNTGNPDALRVLVYTSGTTGMAKGVMLSERNIALCVYNGMRLSKLYDRAISLLPYHHTYEACGILAALNNHTTIFINDSIRNLMANFQYFKPETAYLVPSFLEVFQRRIWNNIGKKKKLTEALITLSNGLRKIGIDLRRVFFAPILKAFGGEMKKVVCGGAPLRAETAAFFESIGIGVVNGYGITECAPLVSITRDSYEDCSTAGVPIGGLEVKIESPDENGIGEICVKGGSVMLGYYKNEEETSRVMKDGYFHTGDLGFIDGEGRITVTGRKKNMIVLKNGKNVFPEEIENYILSIGYIKEAVVTSYKNSKGEESGLCAHVYPDPESNEAKRHDIRDILREDIDRVCAHLPHYKRITRIEIRKEEFAKTTTNKIKRMEI